MEITEKISMPVDVEALSAEEALYQVIKKYRTEQIVVESSEGTQVEISVSQIEG